MGEFVKEKIAFAIGLLAVLFTLTPLTTEFGSVGYELFGATIRLRHLYNFMAVALGIAVYGYGVQFVTRRGRRWVTGASDMFYALAMIAPGIFLALALGSWVTGALAGALTRTAIETITSVVVGIASAVAAHRIQNRLAKRQRQSDEARLRRSEFNALRRAEELLTSGQSDLAVFEAFKALELAVRGSMPAQKVQAGTRDWLESAKARLPKEVWPRLDSLRQLRNAAAHSGESVDPQAAREAVATANKVLALLLGEREDRCPNCSSDGLEEEHGSDHGYPWTRKCCRTCGFVDLS